RPGTTPDRSDEAAAQALRSPESAASGDLLQREIGLLELLSCGSEADLPDIVAGRQTDPVDEVPGEAALAHRDSPREARHRQVLIEMLEHPQLQLAQARVLAELRREVVTELRLAAWALQE